MAVQKLLDMNVRRELLFWIADFLSNRQQCVRLSSDITGRTFTTCGVPQGTKVGPVVFLAMVNQVAVYIPQRWKYVDDITVGESCDPRTPPTSALQQAMDGISRFTTDNHMTLNVDKCGTMQCSFGRDPPPQLDITSNGRRVSNLLSMTLLGVTIAPSLSWEHHVESVISKANSRRYFLVVLRRAGVMPVHLVHFYITFIRPILEYAAPVWHPGLTQRQSHQLETVQRLALRSIYPALPYRLALLTTGLPRLADRRRQLCHDFATSAIESPDFRHWFPRRRRDCHGRELRNSDSLSIPRSTTRFRNSPIIFMSRLLNNNT